MAETIDGMPYGRELEKYSEDGHPFNLNQKQHLFVINYLRTGAKAKSALDAGYTLPAAAATASRLLRNPKVRAYIKALRDRAVEGVEFTPQLVLEQLWRNHELSTGVRPIQINKTVPVYEGKDKDRRIVGYKTVELEYNIFNPDASNKALELIGRHLAMFIDRKALEMPEGLSMTFDFGEGRKATAKLTSGPDEPETLALPGSEGEVVLEI